MKTIKTAKKQKLKESKGITLIALVITIIVLLILAGVTIATLTGDNGILKKAGDAKTQTEQAKEDENLKIAIAGSYGTDGKLNLKDLKDNLENQGINYDKNNTEENAEGTSFVYDIVAQPKNSKMSVEKEIITTDKTAHIGGYVEYKIKTQIPKYGTEYKDPIFNIYDKMSDGLSFVNDGSHTLKVTVGTTEINEGTGTYELVRTGLRDKTFEIRFKKAFLENKDYQGKNVEVTYYAQVNENAVYINTNTAGITYQNKPGETVDSATTEKKVYTYGIDLTKTGDKTTDSDGLDGANFTLTAINGQMINLMVNGTKVEINGETTKEFETITVEKNKGKLIIKGLKAGTYTLQETKSPKGYSLAKNPITIVITANEDGSLKDATVDGTSVKEKVENGMVPVGLENKSGFNLPATGGMGTYLFTIGGLVIMAGAVLLLITSKKKRA